MRQRAIDLGDDGSQALMLDAQATADYLAKQRRLTAEKSEKNRKRKQRRAARKARRGQ